MRVCLNSIIIIVSEYGTFDFIVVGAGSAGCVVASRLSEIFEWNVLLLEAGTYKDENFTSVPAWNGLNINSKYNWGYRTTPQKNSFLGKYKDNDRYLSTHI